MASRIEVQSRYHAVLSDLQPEPHNRRKGKDTYTKRREVAGYSRRVKGKEKTKGVSKPPKTFPKTAQGADCIAVTNKQDRYSPHAVDTKYGVFIG